MFLKAGLVFFTLFLTPALGRVRWLEKHDKPVYLHPRRFGQQKPAFLAKLHEACPGQVCGTLAGQAITPLLAVQPECSQQDIADQIIDASRQFDKATQMKMIALAIEYRQAEKNTPPDFTTNPPTLRNSVFCQKAPRNSELNGLVQAQDPANNPDLFFDPATQKTVKKGEQPNTFPFGTNNSTCSKSSTANKQTSSTGVDTASVNTTTSIGNFGSCSVPQINFGVGFDNRKETSYLPVDQQSYNHGSAQNIDVITQFICDSLTNTCDADQLAKDTCTKAKVAADTATKGTGAQADKFNAVFGLVTHFANVAEVNDNGQVVNTSAGEQANTNNSTCSKSSTANSKQASSTGVDAASVNITASIGSFGSCSVPEIEFGVGFDDRKETSYRAVDQKSYNHGSAQNIDVITQFICDSLTNTCGADQLAKDTCVKAKAAADTVTKGTGAQADKFNAVFGLTTPFTNVPEVNDVGQEVVDTRKRWMLMVLKRR
ncbi:hypothetical protein F5887DRAFT_949554 [Amanita rubescens]|nr:hypothetical protein F5887DRAFT_949554 [Amanita rubescens]